MTSAARLQIRGKEPVLLTEETIAYDEVFSGRVFQVEVQTVKMPDGRPARREIVRHGGGACVLALDGSQGVHMVRQYRKAFDRELLEIPAGKLEAGEAPEACARRELTEETGLRAENLGLLATIYPSPGYCSEILYIYLATGLTAGEACLDDGEHLVSEILPLAEALAMVDRGELPDAKTQIALLALVRRMSLTGPDISREG
jgi:ADP-ribose pyrophosphatase